jgi:Cys-tRNA(Pro)/Cys-tRNA(Cys) deacylase
MAKKKEIKTNAMRILDGLHIPYIHHTYECDEFINGIQIADMLSLPHEIVYKTLITIAKSGQYYVFVIPIEQEIDFKKAARVAGEKAIEMIPVKNITAVSGYVRGGCTAVGMKKQFPTFIQQEAESLERIIVSGGRIGSQLELAPADLARACGGQFADVTACN